MLGTTLNDVSCELCGEGRFDQKEKDGIAEDAQTKCQDEPSLVPVISGAVFGFLAIAGGIGYWRYKKWVHQKELEVRLANRTRAAIALLRVRHVFLTGS